MTAGSVTDADFVFFDRSTGIGRAAAIELGQRGASVLIVERGQEEDEAPASSRESIRCDIWPGSATIDKAGAL